MPSKITTPVIVRLENDLIAQLDTLAAQRSSSRSAMARSALAAGLQVLQRPVQQERSDAPKIRRRSARTKSEAQQLPAPALSIEEAPLAAASATPATPTDSSSVAVAERTTSKGAARGKRKSGNPAATEAPPETGADQVSFAAQVLEAAQRTKTGRFGDDRVFISHVWRQYKREQRPKDMDLEAFKQRLVEANRERYLSLVCADMAPTLNQKDVKESEIRYLSATFHFLCT